MAESWWVDDQGVNTLKGEPRFESSNGEVFRNEIDAQNYADSYEVEIFDWVDDRGNPGNWQTNPIHLPNEFILKCIHEVPQARADLLQALPTMLPAEQDRLNRALSSSPYHLIPLRNEHDVNDAFTNYFNRRGVRTSGPYGGLRNGG